VSDARAASRKVSHTPASPPSSSVPSTPKSPRVGGPPPVRPGVSTGKLPSFNRETPRSFWVRIYPKDVPRFQELVQRYAKSGLVRSTGVDRETGKKVGGRPPAAAEAFRTFLENAHASLNPPRASRRHGVARRVDDAARIGFGRLFRSSPNVLLPYKPSIERVVELATGADRPQRRVEATVDFCEKRLIAGFSVTAGGKPVRHESIFPIEVPDLHFGWGPAIYQTTLDALQGVAA
jgi:hypothetical protein